MNQPQREQKYLEFTFDRVKHVAEKAVLFLLGEEEYWIPKSQIEEDDRDIEKSVTRQDDKGVTYYDPVTISITEWIAKKKELV